MVVPATGQIGDSLLELAKAGKLGEMEAAWLANLATVPTQPAFLKEWLKAVKRGNGLAKGEELAAMLLEDRAENGKWKPGLRAALTLLPTWPGSDALRAPLLRLVRGFYGEEALLETLVAHSGLETKPNLVEAYQAFAELLRLAPGQVYQHYDWGVGVVQALDVDAGKVVIDFPRQPGKTLTLDGVRQFLKYIEPGLFLARRAKEPEELLKLGEDDPAALVRLVMQAQEGQQIRQSDLKALLIDGVIAPEDWNSWWGKAREALKLNPFIDFDASGGARALIRLREKPRTFEEEVEERFFAGDTGVSAKADLIRQLSRHARENTLPAKLVERIARQLGEDWRLTDPEQLTVRLEILYMMADLAAFSPESTRAMGVSTPSVEELLAGLENYSDLIAMDNVDYGIRALVALLERDGEAGCRQAAALLPRAPIKFAQAIWKALDEEHHIDEAVSALQHLIDDPLQNPETFIWAIRAVLDGSWGHLSEYFPVATVVPELLDELENWARLSAEPRKEGAAAAKSLLSKVRVLLSANHFDVFGRSAVGLTREQALRLLRRIEMHTALPDAFKLQAARNITLTRKDLAEESAQAATAPGGAEEAHICTARAYAEKAAELREITSTKIPRNSRVIEEARMEGDLRENAGYQYAKEEQKMLVQQQATLTELLTRAKIFSANQVDASKIGFGTRFTARNNKSGELEQYTVLGRWEADAERHVLSQQAPLAQQFIGRAADEEVLVQHPGGGATPYTIVKIENALAGGEWDDPNANKS